MEGEALSLVAGSASGGLGSASSPWGVVVFAHILGLDNANGPLYLFYSGVGADLPELAIVWALFGWWAKHTCHVHRCCRLARRQYDGHVLCNRHHPIDPPTAESLTDAAKY